MAKKKYLTYEPRQRKILKEDRWIAVLRQEEMCSLDDIATEIAFRSTAGKSEVEGLLLAFLEQIKYHLVGGDGVKINGLGTFYPRVIGRAVDNVENILNLQTSMNETTDKLKFSEWVTEQTAHGYVVLATYSQETGVYGGKTLPVAEWEATFGKVKEALNIKYYECLETIV